VSCTLPGATSPTPFSFPTPNLTHTAIFSTPSTPFEDTPTNTPVVVLADDTSTSPDEGDQPTATGTPDDSGEIALDTVIPEATSSSLNSRSNGSPVTAGYRTDTITIDGDLSEWTTTAYTANETVPYAGSGWSGASDASATFYIAWDADNLYIAVKRTDDTFVQTAWGRYMYKGDDVEIQLDTDLAGDFYSASMSNDDYQIGFSPGNFGSLDAEVYRWFPRSLEAWIKSADIAAKKDGNGYNLEVEIPWSAFGLTPTAGSRYGFALSLSDNDTTGVSTWQSMISNVNTRRATDPTTWGTLILESHE
jgi:hypothetical protein